MPTIPIAQVQEPAGALVVMLFLVACLVSLAFWLAMLVRYQRRGTILPRQRRRRVPWHGIDVLVVVVAYVALSVVAVAIIGWLLGPDLVRSLPREEAAGPHAIVEAMAAGGTYVLLLCVIAAVVVAPVAEEFLFRVLLQGWLEAFVRRLWPYLPRLRRWLPGASLPILVSASLFAALHIRVAGPGRHAEFLVALLLSNAVVSVLVVTFAVVWLRVRVGATGADLGLVPGKLAADVGLGLGSLVGLLGPIYAIQIASHLVLPKHVAPDPVPLFFLALGLGLLYARTHRLLPCVVLHAALNAAGLAMAWATL